MARTTSELSSGPGRARSTAPPGATRPPHDALPLAMVWVAAVVFAIGPVMVAAASISGALFSFWRLWFGVAITAVAAVVHRIRTGTSTSRTGWLWAARCGAAFAVHQLMFMISIRVTSVVDVTLMNTLAPLVVAFLAARLFGERPGRSFRAWSLVAIAGAMVVVVSGSSGPTGDPGGMALAAGNVVFYAVFLVWSKEARRHIDTIPFLFGSVLVSAVCVTGFVLVTGERPGQATARDLLLCFVVALVPGAIGHFSMTWALRWVPANLPAVILLCEPILAGVLAWLVLGEGVTATTVLGGTVTLAGVLGALRSSAELTRDEAAAAAGEGI